MNQLAANQNLDAIEKRMLAELPVVHMPVEHLFTPGLYRRTITMPPGSLLTSKVHRTEHPYAILRGFVYVLVIGDEPVMLGAGYEGVTKPGTRRVLFVPDDSEPCVWSTYHTLSTQEERMRQRGASNDELIAAIEERIIEPHNVEVHQEYIKALNAAGLPGPNEGRGAVPCLG